MDAHSGYEKIASFALCSSTTHGYAAKRISFRHVRYATGRCHRMHTRPCLTLSLLYAPQASTKTKYSWSISSSRSITTIRRTDLFLRTSRGITAMRRPKFRTTIWPTFPSSTTSRARCMPRKSTSWCVSTRRRVVDAVEGRLSHSAYLTGHDDGESR